MDARYPTYRINDANFVFTVGRGDDAYVLQLHDMYRDEMAPDRAPAL